MRLFSWLLMFLAFSVLTGCRDKTELEERGFVGAFSIDSCEENGIVLGVEFMRVPQGRDGEEETERTVKRASGKNFADAMYELTYLNSKELSFSLSKACLLGEGLLKDAEKLRDTANALDQDSEISGKLIITAARGDAVSVLENIPEGENSVGEYIANYYKHRRNKANPATQLSLNDFAEAMRGESGVVVPVISYNEESGAFNFKSAALVKDSLAEYAENDELAGLTWAKGSGRGRLLTVKIDGSNAALRVTSQQTRYNFREDDSRSICSISVRTSGTLEEEPETYLGSDEQAAMLQRVFAKAIIEEVKKAYKYLAEQGIDGFGLAERMKKRNPELYAKYGSPVGSDLEIKVSVEITN